MDDKHIVMNVIKAGKKYVLIPSLYFLTLNLEG